MPNFLETPDILPLPSLQTYSSISFLLLSCALYYAFQVSSEPDWKLVHGFGFKIPHHHHLHHAVFHQNHNIDADQNETTITINGTANINDTVIGRSVFNETERNNYFESFFNKLHYHHANDTGGMDELLRKNPHLVTLLNVAYVMVHEPLCVWTLINMSYCLLILFGKLIQKLVFGNLRQTEQQLLRDKFWSFVLYKFIFVFSVINVQRMDELILWCAWFSVLGFMFLLTHLCKMRFDYLAFSPSVSKWDHGKLMTLLSLILISSMPLFLAGLFVGMHTNVSIGAFLLSEVLLTSLRTLNCFILYLVHLWDLSREYFWEKRTAIIYYIDLIFEILILSIDLCHHLHMLCWANIILSVSSLVILIQLRALFTDIIRRIKKHNNYLRVLSLMEENFPIASKEELTDENSDCAICWDRMESARKLPCNHMFHTTCLRSWLEQDTSCPTCRHSLRHRDEHDGSIAMGDAGVAAVAAAATTAAAAFDGMTATELAAVAAAGLRQAAANPANTRFFHFDGSRYSRWLPTVSVELTRPNMIDININANITTAMGSNESGTSTAAGNGGTLPELAAAAQQQIEYMGQQVLEWFPQFPLAYILDDLRATRSVEHTIENILDGRLRQPSSDLTESRNDDQQNNRAGSSLENNYNFIFTPQNRNDYGRTESRGQESSSGEPPPPSSFDGGPC